MTDRSKYPTRKQTGDAIANVQSARLPVAAVETWPDGRICVKVGEPLVTISGTDDPALNEYLRETTGHGEARHEH